MSDVLIRKVNRAGRVTLSRPAALNALTCAMVQEIDAALRGWIGDPEIELVVIDAEGPRAFCAGGDIAEPMAAAWRAIMPSARTSGASNIG